MIAVASAAVLTLSATAFAQGTATEAKAMLETAVVALKADRAKTLDTINEGEGEFLRNRDLLLRLLLQYQRRQGRCYWRQ